MHILYLSPMYQIDQSFDDLGCEHLLVLIKFCWVLDGFLSGFEVSIDPIALLLYLKC